MVNPDAEINRLRSLLMSRRADFSTIDAICDAASKDINEVILDIVSNGMAEAVEYAVELGAEDFIEDMDIVNVGGSYQVITRSGKTDFSTPPMPMLPHLLKNAKVAKDGSRYRVIPVGGESSGKKTMGRSIFEDQRALQGKIQVARETLRESLNANSNQRSGEMIDKFRDMVRGNMPTRQSFYNRSHSRRANPEFRTASSKQDPNTQWVTPAKELDMTGFLMNLNTKIQQDIVSSVMTIVNEYEKVI